MQGKEEKLNRRGGKTILRDGQGWILRTQLGQLKTGLGGKGLLLNHMWSSIVFPPEIKKGMVNFLRKGHFSA